MEPKDLEVLILELMRDIYNAEYIGKLKVEQKGEGYLIKFGLHNNDYPLIIYTEQKGDDLIKFLRQELHNRQFSSNDYWSIDLVYKAQCQPINKKCCDERCTDR